MISIDDLDAISKPVLDKVYPPLADRVYALIRSLYLNGLYFGAFMGLRTWEEQDALYAQGRTDPGKIVTKAKGGQSWHNFGLAVDIVEDGDPNNAGIHWSWSNNADYLKVGTFADTIGLEWGGYWKAFKDYPHVQFTEQLTLDTACGLYKVGGLQAVWDEVTKRTEGIWPSD